MVKLYWNLVISWWHRGSSRGDQSLLCPAPAPSILLPNQQLQFLGSLLYPGQERLSHSWETRAGMSVLAGWMLGLGRDSGIGHSVCPSADGIQNSFPEKCQYRHCLSFPQSGHQELQSSEDPMDPRLGVFHGFKIEEHPVDPRLGVFCDSRAEEHPVSPRLRSVPWIQG